MSALKGKWVNASVKSVKDHIHLAGGEMRILERKRPRKEELADLKSHCVPGIPCPSKTSPHSWALRVKAKVYPSHRPAWVHREPHYVQACLLFPHPLLQVSLWNPWIAQFLKTPLCLPQVTEPWRISAGIQAGLQQWLRTLWCLRPALCASLSNKAEVPANWVCSWVFYEVLQIAVNKSGTWSNPGGWLGSW